MASSDHYCSRGVCLSVPVQNFVKQNNFQVRRAIATGGTVGLTEGIVDDSSLVFLCICSWMQLGDLQKSEALFNRSYQAYVREPFKVIMTNKGCVISLGKFTDSLNNFRFGQKFRVVLVR